MKNTFSTNYKPTESKQVCFSSMLLDSSVIECKLVDLTNATLIPIIVAASKTDLAKDLPKQDFSATVRKTWHSRYVECSAKYNLNIATIFKEVTRKVIKQKDGATNENEEDRQQCCRIFR